MKYPLLYLVPAYFTILDGNITVGGVTLPIYDGQAPADPLGSYIVIGERNSQQIPGKGVFNSEVFILVDCCIKGSSFGFEESDEAATQVMGLINSDANPDCTPDFQVISTSIQSTNNLSGLNPTDNIARTLIRFRHLVKQL